MSRIGLFSVLTCVNGTTHVVLTAFLRLVQRNPRDDERLELMHHFDQRWPGFRPPSLAAVSFTVGERVSIVSAPASYGDDGRAGTVIGLDGLQIRV